RRLLLRRIIEDDAAILLAEIRTLPVELRRVVNLPESVEQLLVAHLLGIERDFHHLGVPGRVGTNFLVTGVLCLPAHVARNGINHPRDLAERRLNTPEAARAKRGLFHGPLLMNVYECNDKPDEGSGWRRATPAPHALRTQLTDVRIRPSARPNDASWHTC